MMLSFRDHKIQFSGIPAQDGGICIEIMVNPSEKRMCLLLSDKRNKDASPLKTRTIQPEIAYIDKCTLFIGRIYGMMGWNKNLNYLLKGYFTARTGGVAWMFRLNQAECMLVADYGMPKLPGQAPNDWVKGMVGV